MRENVGRWQRRLSGAEVEELRAAVAHSEAFEGRLDRMGVADFPLPTLAAQAAIWRATISKGRGFVLLRGLPVDRWSEAELERAYWGLGLHIGLPGAQNDFGELLGHVRDERLGAGADVRQYRTAEEIPFHCDAADAVALLCVRKAKRGGHSRIASSVSVFNAILERQPQLAARLFEPFALDTHAEQGLGFMPMVPAAYYKSALRLFMHPGYFRSGAARLGAPELDEKGRAVLELFEELASSERFCLDMAFEPGDVQLLSNHSVVHARGEYEDHDALEHRRHLLRLWLSFDDRPPAGERWARLQAKFGLAKTRLLLSRSGS